MAPRSADERLMRMHELDLKRQNSLHKTELIHRGEEARKLKLRVLELRDENALLQEKISQKDSRLAENLKQGKRMRADIGNATAAARLAEGKWRKQITELHNLRAEVEALNGSTQDNAKTLQEKFALAREVNKLKPELEHLQSQISSYQAVIAEKNDLRRQLDSLEVELESEKRSKSKPRTKDDLEASFELKGKLEQAERALTLEKKEREKMEKAHEKEMVEASDKNDRVEERVSTLKTKLKTAQTELKKTQATLAETHEDLKKATTAAAEGIKQGIITKANAYKKRRAQEIADDMANIGTPGYDEAMSKRARKRGPEQVAMAEKSTFSVTPFLNRSQNPVEDSLDSPIERGNGRAVSFSEKPEISATPRFADDSKLGSKTEVPAAVEEEAEESECEATPEPKMTVGNQLSADKLQTLASSKPKITGETAASKENLMASPSMRKPAKQAKPKSIPSTTNDGSEAEPDGATLPNTEPELILAATKKSGETEGVKKKRKLLGSAATNLFDNDGEEVPKRPAKTQLGPTRKSKTALEGVKNAFSAGGFSPLKRDRRGVGASFLA